MYIYNVKTNTSTHTYTIHIYIHIRTYPYFPNLEKGSMSLQCTWVKHCRSGAPALTNQPWKRWYILLRLFVLDRTTNCAEKIARPFSMLIYSWLALFGYPLLRDVTYFPHSDLGSIHTDSYTHLHIYIHEHRKSCKYYVIDVSGQPRSFSLFKCSSMESQICSLSIIENFS